MRAAGVGRRMTRRMAGMFLLAALAGTTAAEAQPIRRNPGFYTHLVPRNDDQSSGLEPLGFTINFFGKIRTAAYVNNNGNLTFDSDLATFTPFGLLRTQREIIAPFFADVDTRPDGSQVVTFGQDVINGRRAFAANYVNVGYYALHVDKLNSFQVVLISREDQGPGDFDIEFNYEAIKWETGDASGGVNGFGGTSAAVGWSNGTDTAFELPGSLIPGSFLDGGPYSLVRQSISGRVGNTPGAPAGTRGRLIFRARDGQISPGLAISGGLFSDATLGVPYSAQLGVAGADPPYTWALIPDVAPPPGLTLNPSTGVLSGTPTTAGTYSFTLAVTANTEDGEIMAFERGVITIRPPVLRITTYCPVNDAYAGVPYSLRLEASGSTTGYVWSVDDPASIPPGMALNANGLLAGTPLEPGTYQMSLRAAAGGSSDARPAVKLCRLQVNPAAVRLAQGCSLAPATVGVPYVQFLDGAGGFAPYEFQLIGQLPKGVALTPEGLVAGTPEFWGVWPFKVATTDSAGARTVQDCSMIVHPARFSLEGSCPLPDGVTGVPYSVNLGGGYSWAAIGSLPAGLSLAPDGRVSGTPMAAGARQFRLIATNSRGEQAGEACSLRILRGPLAMAGCPLPDARRGDPYTAAVRGVGGFEPYTFVAAGTLPPGVVLGTDGRLSGTPTQAGVFPFSVLVRDATLASTVQACSLTVAPSELRFTTACPLPDAQAGQRYSVRINAAGGTPPYSFLIQGFLPDGLTADAQGNITGTPLRVGGRAFTVYALDSAGAVQPQACSIAVTAPQAPAVSLADPPATVAPAATNLVLQVRLAEPFNAPVEGKLVMSVATDTLSSSAVGQSPDPRLAFANGQRTVPFTIPAGSTSVNIPVASTGTVASTVTVSLADLRASGAPLAQNPAAKVFRIPASAPSLTSLCYARTDTGLDFRVTGISTTRELGRAVFNIPGLTPLPRTAPLPPLPPELIFGSTPGELVVDLARISGDYFGSAANVRFGGGFTLSVPVDVDLAPDAPRGEVGVNLFNGIGESGRRIVPRCQ
jgi:hypothetical protein